MDTAELLRNAKSHCFFVGLNDSGTALCKSNSVYGIAGIHYIQNQLGINPNTTFISEPGDFSATLGMAVMRGIVKSCVMSVQIACAAVSIFLS